MGAAAVPIIMGGSSLISGVAGINAKNKAAAAQREQLQSESYRQAQSDIATQQTLASQQALNRTQYEMGVIARQQQFQQADAGIRAQSVLADLRAQQEAYAARTAELEQAGQLASRAQQLERGATQNAVNANQLRGQSDTAVAQQSAEASQALSQLGAATAADITKERSLAGTGNKDTASAQTRSDSLMRNRVALALAAGLELDQSQVARHMQSLNEEELAGISEQIGLNDINANVQTVADNLKMLRRTTEAATQNSASDNELTQQALNTARKTNNFSTAMDARSQADAYLANDFSLGTQRSLNTQTSASLRQSNAAAQNQIKGAGLLDYLKVGADTYMASSGAFGKGGAKVKAPSRTGTLYSGFPTNNVG